MSTFTLRRDLPSLTNGMVYIQEGEIIAPRFEPERGIVCAYCGGMYSSKLFKCPNCAAPRMEKVTKANQYTSYPGEVVGTIYDPFAIKKSNCMLKIREQTRYEYFKNTKIKIPLGIYTAQELSEAIHARLSASGISIRAYSKYGKLGFRTSRTGCGESLVMVSCKNSILPTIGVIGASYSGSTSVE